MPGRLTSSHLVGRQNELAELELAFLEAQRGAPSLILVGGDSGVGKTRLLAEAEQRFEDALVLRGESLEQGDGELPYAPLLGALRPLVRDRDPILGELAPGNLAYLAALLPSLGGAQPPATSGNDADGAAQVRLFETLLELLHRLSERQPVVLILEDVHWADRSTRTFTAFLARSLRSERVLLVLTYRSDELHRRHPLRPLLAELDRIGGTRRLELEPFDRGEVAEALGDILGRSADEQLIDRLLVRTEGNPLHIEELLAAALDGRGAAPQSLRDAFILRIERLSPDARLAARAVAVGNRLDQAKIAAVSGVPAERLSDALRETVAEHVLVADQDGRFRFRHALLREALYDDLLPDERGDLHIELASALDERGRCEVGEDEVERVASIASHYAAAGDQTRALRATVRAGYEAQRVLAYGEAADLAERALELWPRVPQPEQHAGIDHAELLELAGGGHLMADDRVRSAVLLERAVDELDPQTHPVRYARVMAKLSRVYWGLNRGPEGIDAANRALAALPPDDATVERAELLAWLARTRVLRGRYREAITDGELALSVAQDGGHQAVVGAVLNTLGVARIATGEVERGEAQMREAMAVSREQRDQDDLAVAYVNFADFLALAGRTSEALQIIREGLAETAAQNRRSHGWMELTLTSLAFEAGEWETARSTARPPTSSLVGTMLIYGLLVEAELALGEGRDETAAASLATAAPLVMVSTEAQWHGGYGSLAGELHRRAGDLEAAVRAVQKALDELEICTDDVMRIARVTAVGIGAEADRALRARDLKDDAARDDALKRIEIHLGRLAAAAEDGGPVEAAWFAVGTAEAKRATGANDAALWSAAARAWEQLERPYPAATARWREAEALTEAGEREAAAAKAAAAVQVAAGLGAEWLLGELEALIARGRLPAPAPAEGGANAPAVDAAAIPDHRAADELPFGLTPREHQVLVLIAEGATNRQIGAALFMAEKTASVHVSRILAKLDVQSRTQAAAVAHRMHLS